MNIDKMSDKGAVATIKDICDGLKRFVENNPGSAKEVLFQLVETLDSIDEDDFFGTEGWKHGLGVED